MRIAVVGGGISGIAAARLLAGVAQATVFERQERAGGLVRCDRLAAGLFHRVGGHVFNTKSVSVAKWFWAHFDREREFVGLRRDARILLGGAIVGYPLENHLHQLPEAMRQQVERELRAAGARKTTTGNFRDFLLATFGPTLCEAYFFPYNEKMWRCDLGSIPLDWLEGKLPMPDAREILRRNALRLPETEMVHAKFHYPRRGGSQFVIDRLAQGLDLRPGCDVSRLTRAPDGRWRINGDAERFDRVIYTGDVRSLAAIAPQYASSAALREIQNLRTRGITSAFCTFEATTQTWLYLPDREWRANRIVYTGGFSAANNGGSRMTGVVEFPYPTSPGEILRELERLPGSPEFVASHQTRDAYIIHDGKTRRNMRVVRHALRADGLHLLGRFAEWEYYNMDACIESALRVVAEIAGGKFAIDTYGGTTSRGGD
ncbi:MAG TPA: FAD-dependent oxidoreductase [Opitutus sp.]|nr:FAD-dependent oxidoreductase [Opitutus sp.]